MADGFSFEEDDKKGASPTSQGGFSWDQDKSAPQAESTSAQTQTPAEPSTWEKLTRGYNPDVEQFAEKHPVIGPVVRGLDAAGGAAMNLIPSVLSGAKDAGELFTGNTEPMLRDVQSISDWFNPKTRPTARQALSVLPEAIGQGVGTVATGEATGEAARNIPKLPQSVAETARVRTPRNPTGALKPAVRTVGQAGGATIGALSTHSPYGALAGYAFGPKLLDMLIPDLKPAEPTPVYGPTRMNPEHIAQVSPEGRIPKVGSPEQEAGYYPAVTKVPIRPEPPYRLTPESVPGPDTAGKGNLLTPLAKRGDPRAAAELQRRGRLVLHVPAEGYPPPREVIRNIGEEPESQTIPEIQRTRRLPHAAD